MKKVIWVIVILVLGGIGYGIYLYNKPHRDIVNEAASVEMKAEMLATAYSENQQKADSIYLDKVVEISGVISDTEDNALVIDDQVYCTMDSTANLSEVGQGASVNIKGRVVGYDDLFGQVKMDNCVLMNY